MSAIEKLIKKYKKNNESIRFKDLDKILLFVGFEKITTKGSHIKYKKEGFIIDIVIPVHNNECKGFYKKQAYKIIKKLL